MGEIMLINKERPLRDSVDGPTARQHTDVNGQACDKTPDRNLPTNAIDGCDMV